MNNDYSNILQLTTPCDALDQLQSLIRTARQRHRWTIKDLSSRAGVPESTISRIERTGLASTTALFKVLHALDELTTLVDCLKEQQRRNSLPTSLADLPEHRKVIQRVRHPRNDSP